MGFAQGLGGPNDTTTLDGGKGSRGSSWHSAGSALPCQSGPAGTGLVSPLLPARESFLCSLTFVYEWLREKKGLKFKNNKNKTLSSKQKNVFLPNESKTIVLGSVAQALLNRSVSSRDSVAQIWSSTKHVFTSLTFPKMVGRRWGWSAGAEQKGGTLKQGPCHLP